MKPKAFIARATNSPCSWMRFVLPVVRAAVATACAEGSGRKSVAETVNRAAFEVDTAKAVGCGEGNCVVEERPGLLGVGDVATEEDDSGGTNQLEPGALKGGQLCAR